MGIKINTTNLTNFEGSSAVNTVNDNFDDLADEFDEVVYRDGSFDMTDDLNMGSNRILNVGDAENAGDALSLGRFYDLAVGESAGATLTELQVLRDEATTAATAASSSYTAAHNDAILTQASAAQVAAIAADLEYDLPASAFAGDEEDVLAMDFTTTDTAHNTWIKDLSDPTNDFDGDVADLIPTAFQNSVSVVNEAGATVASGVGNLPYDWSKGERTLKITAATLLSITSAMFTFGPTMTIYMDFYHGGGADNPLLLENATDFADIRMNGTDYQFDLWNGFAADPTGQKRSNIFGIYQPTTSDRVEVVYRFKDEDHGLAINGEPPMFIPKHRRQADGSHAPADSFTPTTFRIQGGGGTTFLYLRRLLITKRAVADVNLANFRRGAGNPYVVASIPVTKAFEDSHYERTVEGCVSVLSDGSFDGTALFNVVHTQRRYDTDGGVVLSNGEASARLKQRTFLWREGDVDITPLTAASSVFYQPTNNSTGFGHGQQGSTFVRDQGPHKGRVYRLHTQLDGTVVSQNDNQLDEGERNIYLSYSDQRGKSGSWSTPVKVLDATTVGASFALMSPSGTHVQYAESHPDYPGRIVVPFYAGPTRLLYCDPDVNGDLTNWVAGAVPTGLPTGINVNEAAIVLAPNGDIIAVCRSDQGADIDNCLVILRSPSGGETLQFERILVTDANNPINNVGALTPLYTTGYVGAAATPSAIQLDPLGVYSPTVGRIGIFRVLHLLNPDRYGLRFSALEDETFTPYDSVDIATGIRTIGNTSAGLLFGGRYAVVSHSSGIDLNQNARESYIVTLVAIPRRGVRE